MKRAKVTKRSGEWFQKRTYQDSGRQSDRQTTSSPVGGGWPLTFAVQIDDTHACDRRRVWSHLAAFLLDPFLLPQPVMGDDERRSQGGKRLGPGSALVLKCQQTKLQRGREGEREREREREGGREGGSGPRQFSGRCRVQVSPGDSVFRFDS
ncbi:hypothetical protein LZ32DRAFT_305552 [Colletotrichum eremochloae]|nr:hypothetical protein LZ32DRAFT_305552 [Colletotrichum eremochloae]